MLIIRFSLNNMIQFERQEGSQKFIKTYLLYLDLLSGTSLHLFTELLLQLDLILQLFNGLASLGQQALFLRHLLSEALHLDLANITINLSHF